MILRMIRIGLQLERRWLSLRYPRLSATGRGKHADVEVALAQHKDIFIAAKAFRARCLKARGNAQGNNLARKNYLAPTILPSDQRGAVAFEMPIVWLFLVMSLLLPLADVAIAGFQFVSAWGALRAFGQYIQLHPPPDVTNTSSWALPTTVAGYPISNVRVLCGDTNAGAVCSSANVTLPTKYYSYTTTVTLQPMVLRAVLCNANPCSFTLSSSERLQ
jgi:hypothetical protein